jgi:hypothetical protein
MRCHDFYEKRASVKELWHQISFFMGSLLLNEGIKPEKSQGFEYVFL